jgi:hypothetical protein
VDPRVTPNIQLTNDLSLKNLKYYSYEQALADLLSIKRFLVETKNLKKNKWVLFGGGLSGTLAA